MDNKELKKFVIRELQNGLSEKHTYHGVHHTKSVLEICKLYVGRMNISETDAFLLYTAALMHDIGFTRTYDNHEEESILIAKEILPGWGFSEEEIEKISGMIRATKIPQKPRNILEQIIGDSDLDYLGTDSFHEISETLYEELLAYNKITTRDDWNKLQVKFLQNHAYHTLFAQKHREPVKQKHLKEIIQKWGWQ